MASIDSPVFEPVLDKRCSSAHISKISEHIENWQELAPYFGLAEAEQQEILNNHAHQYKVQKRKMVWKWVRKQGDRATYRELKRVFEEAGESLLVFRVDELLQDAYSQAPHNIVNSFREYLKDCYCGNPATSRGQMDWPPQLSQSPFVKPELVLKPKPQWVAGSKQPSSRQELRLEDLCRLGKKVMLEGTAGSGKTTLTRHICQQWAEGKLFHDVNLLIHLTLADPALWSAKSLEDIIPYPSAEMRKTVADHIEEQGGKRCCFILDGWEDLPEGSSFIHKVLEGKQPRMAALPHCLFIVTSRPVATPFLQPLVSTAVEITGFSHESVDTYATQYLTQVGRNPTVFIIALNSNHHARRLCSLPINAAILLHMFLTIQTGLPSTQTELLKCFILNLLLRHLIAKVGHKCRSLREFSDLPSNEKRAFNNLCLIAHYSTISGKASSQKNQLLSSDDLQKAVLHDIEDTLGLMKVHQQLTWCGYDPHYGFLHSSVQDFLCAVRMSQLSSEEQVRDFTHILNTNPTSLVLHFYAGLTKLENKSVFEQLRSILRELLSQNCIDQVDATQYTGGDPRIKTCLRCLYEANMTGVLVEFFNSSDLESFIKKGFEGKQPGFAALRVAPSTASTGDHSSILIIDNLFEVQMLVKQDVNWKDLGLALGLAYTTLQTIEREHERKNDCMREMLTAWLQQQDNVAEKGVPNWAVLKTALDNLESELDREMTKHTSDKTVMESIKVTVTMRIIKIEAQGYPGTGKTSLLNLAMGKNPAPIRNSTGFVEPPSRYMVSETSEGKWDELSTDMILEMISEEVKKVIDSQDRVSLMEYEQSAFEDKATPFAEDVSSVPTPAMTEISQPSVSPQSVSSIPSTSLQLQSNESSIKLPTDTSPPTTSLLLPDNSKKSNPYSVFSELLKEVDSIKHSTVIFSLKWVIVSDCGGQPPFLDASALFLRNSCLRIIPLKLSDRLEQSPDVSYFVSGSNCLTDSYVPLTNLQTIETFAKSVAAIQPLCTPSTEGAQERRAAIHPLGTPSTEGTQERDAAIQPLSTPSTEGAQEGHTCRCKFTIVGTFKDQEHESESVEKKEEILKDVLQPYEFFQVREDRIILPINAVVEPGPERDKAAADLRKLIETSETAREYEVKLSWFVYLLSLMKMAKTKNKAILSIKDDKCFELAESLGMEKDETIKAIKFFHDIGLVMHFDGTADLEDCIVVNDKPVLGKISQLLSVSFIKIEEFNKLYASAHKQSHQSFFSETPPGETPLSYDTQDTLQKYGRFNRRYLRFLNLTDKELDFFLKMLVHINAIAETIKNKEYFMPCALPYKREPEPPYEFPWIIRFRMKMERAGVSVGMNYIPPPVGYLPALVVTLVTEFSGDFRYQSGNKWRQYRNSITLAYKTDWRICIIERHLQLEFYFSGGCKFRTEFSNIRQCILEAISTTEKKLQIADTVKRLDCFLCTCGKDCSSFSALDCKEGHVCVYYDREKGYHAVCDESHQDVDVNTKCLFWMKAPGDSVLTTPSTQDPVKPAVSHDDQSGQIVSGNKPMSTTTQKSIAASSGRVVLDSKPEISALICFKYKDEQEKTQRIHIMDKIAAKWKRFGACLKFSPSSLANIESTCHHDVEACVDRLLTLWLEGHVQDVSQAPITWETLLEALRDVRLGKLADDLTDLLTSHDDK